MQETPHEQTTIAVEAQLERPNFYEKALFVKSRRGAALCGMNANCSALRATLLFALPVSQLSSDSVHYGIRLFELEALQSSDRPSPKVGQVRSRSRL